MNIHDYEHERGHSLKPEPEVLAAIPPLYATDDTPTADKLVYVRYFAGGCDWYLMELDPKEWLAFGWCDLGQGFAELGYFSLHELGGIQAAGLLRFVTEDDDGNEHIEDKSYPVYVERDLHWSEQHFDQIKP